MFIGEKIRELRKAQNMSLVELAKKSGVQIATLSRMEHLKMTGSVTSHGAVAKALGVELSYLYSDVTKPENRIALQTLKSTSDVYVHDDDSSYKILTNNVLSKRMMPGLIKINPHGKTKKEKGSMGAEKFIFVLEGKIEARVGKNTFPLSKHNTLYFDASLEHNFINTGKTHAQVICVATPVML